MALDKVPRALHAKYEIHEWRHASAILLNDFPSEWADILDVLNRFVLKKSQIVTPGGSKSAISIWMDKELTAKGWNERKFDTSVKMGGACLEFKDRRPLVRVGVCWVNGAFV